MHRFMRMDLPLQAKLSNGFGSLSHFEPLNEGTIHSFVGPGGRDFCYV